jgi:dolichyl-phosphate-mannose-protein mannosyltransferase
LSSCVLILSLYFLWRSRTPGTLMLAIFIALLGNFLFSPRMHERYLYPALVFFIPAILDSPFLTGAFVLITINWLFNLNYVFQVLRTTQYLPSHDPLAMVSSAFNVLVFGAIITYVAFDDSLPQTRAQPLTQSTMVPGN